MLNAAGEGFEASHFICSARFGGLAWTVGQEWDATDSTVAPLPKKCSVFKGSRRVTLRRIEQSLTIIDHTVQQFVGSYFYFAGGAMHQICPVEE